MTQLDGWDYDRVTEAVCRVEATLHSDPLRMHTNLTAEQLALDSRMMAKQVVSNVLLALDGKGATCNEPSHPFG